LKILQGAVMKKHSEEILNPEKLREEAEKKLGVRKKKKREELLPEEAGRIIHELEVHQIELEMQNEELRRAHVQLEDSRSKYADLYDFAPVGYFTFDEKGLILELNLTGAGMLGIERSRLIKKPFSTYIPKEYQDEFFLHRKKVFATLERQTCEIKLKNKQGDAFYAQLESIPSLDPKGRKTCRTSVIDVTGRKQAEAQLIQMVKLSAMGEMAGGLAHELNSPLCGLLPMIEKYRNEAKEGTKEKMELSLMLRACEHMARIVRDFGSFFRKPKSEFYELDLNEVIENTLSFSTGSIRKKGIQIIKEYEDALPRVRGEMTALQQVVLNMVSNAGDAMPDGGRLIIKTGVSEDNKYAVMEFIDTGAGIHKNDLKKIFDPFFTTKRLGKGVGLGLSLSHTIIQKHGGEIAVESKPGKGTKIRISLPAVRSNH